MRSLAIIVIAAVVAWLLFIAGQYVELITSMQDDWEYGDPEPLRFTQYFTVAAIVLLGLGALVAKRRLAPVRATAPRSALVDPVAHFASLTLIIAAVLAVWAVLMLFLGGFFNGSVEPAPLARTVNLYAPIVLYTALVVTLILAGFVFAPQVVPQIAPQFVPQAATPAAVGAAPAEAPNRQSLISLAYATPIIATAIGLVLGLVVYDLTRSSLQVWIWVAILAIVGAGVIAGSLLAVRGGANGAPGVPAPPVAIGAQTLNFVLSVIFAVVVSGMSLSYGSSAVHGLSAFPSLSLSAFGESEKSIEKPDGTGGAISIDDPLLTLWGSDLKRGSEVTVTLEPSGRVLISKAVGGDRWVSAEQRWPSDLAAGDYELVTRATAGDGEAIEFVLKATATSTSEVRFPDGSTSSHDAAQSRLSPVTAGWVFGDLLPAGLLLALALAVVVTTITARNRDRLDAGVVQAPNAL